MKTKNKIKVEAGRKGGTVTWADVPKKERTRIMTLRAKQLWVKIRAGSLAKK